MDDVDKYYPPVDSSPPPSWINNARVLYESVLEKDPHALGISTRKPRFVESQLGKHRHELTMEYLEDVPWLAKGYIYTAMGVRANSKPISEIDDLADTAMRLFTAWFDALEKQSHE